jgi:hypothetical protein
MGRPGSGYSIPSAGQADSTAGLGMGLGVRMDPAAADIDCTSLEADIALGCIGRGLRKQAWAESEGGRRAVVRLAC